MVNYLQISDNFANFVAWIGGSCKPSDKGKLTAFPRFIICQHNVNKNVSNMLRFEELPEINSERWLSLEDLPGEVWKDAVGFEEVLQVSCYGRVKRKRYIGWHPVSKETIHKEKMLRLSSLWFGHLQCRIYYNGKAHNLTVHRLVSKAFIPNPQELPVINHMDENPRNNCVYNLEWCTQKHNSNWGNAPAKRIEAMKRNGMIRPVVLYDYDGNIIEEYESVSEAERKNNLKGLVSYCCLGKISTAKGLHFRFKGEPYKKRKVRNQKAIYSLILPNGEVKNYYGTMEFSRAIGINAANIICLISGKIEYSKSLKDKHIIIKYCTGEFIEIYNGIVIKRV